MGQGCEFVGWCALGSHQWLSVIVGGFAAIATIAAVLVALWNSNASKREADEKAKALLKFKGPMIASALAHAAEVALDTAARATHGQQDTREMDDATVAFHCDAAAGTFLDDRHGARWRGDFVAAATESYIYARLQGEDLVAIGLSAELINRVAHVIVLAEKAERSVRAFSLESWLATPKGREKMSKDLAEIRKRSLALAAEAELVKAELQAFIEQKRSFRRRKWPSGAP